MNKIILTFLIGSSCAHGALHMPRTLTRCASRLTPRQIMPLKVIRKVHTRPLFCSANLPVHPIQKSMIKQDPNTNHSFETAEKPPESVRYNINWTMEQGNYSFAPFHHFATFTQLHNTGFTHIYVGSEHPIKPDSTSGELNTKSVALEKKDISEHFGNLSSNLQTILKKKILDDSYYFSNGDSTAKRWSTIAHILGQLNPILRTYYEKCIIDLATNKLSLSPYSVSLKRQWSRPDHDHYRVTRLTTFITVKQSITRSLMAKTVAFISKAPQQVADGAQVITSRHADSRQNALEGSCSDTSSPYTLLQVHADATQEQIKQAYYAQRFEAESRKDAAAVQALTDAYNKLRK